MRIRKEGKYQVTVLNFSEDYTSDCGILPGSDVQSMIKGCRKEEEDGIFTWYRKNRNISYMVTEIVEDTRKEEEQTETEEEPKTMECWEELTEEVMPGMFAACAVNSDIQAIWWEQRNITEEQAENFVSLVKKEVFAVFAPDDYIVIIRNFAGRILFKKVFHDGLETEWFKYLNRKEA